MALNVTIDVFGQRVIDGKARATVEQGRQFLVMGWAADPGNGTVSRAVHGIVDGVARYTANLVVRVDVAEHFGNPALAGSGFDLSFETQLLSVGTHRLQVMVEASDGTVQDCGIQTFTVVPPESASLLCGPRIVIGNAPKSGSTYTHNLLKRYFGLDDPPPGEQGSDYGLDYLFLNRVRGRPFILSAHMKPYPYTVLAARRENITTIATWRNLADMIVSFDDHMCSDSFRLFGQNIIFELDQAAYRTLPDQQRYQFVVLYGLSWFVSFYLGWKNGGAIFAHYEDMAVDSTRHFAELIEKIDGSVDRERLDRAIAAPMSKKESNLNVGRNYRSIEKFSDETKRMLEDTLRHHYAPLDELIDELPWRLSRQVRAAT